MNPSPPVLAVGVIGLGRIGWDFHCHQLKQLPGYRLQAVCDTSADYRRKATEALGVPAYDSTVAMLAAGPLDVVVIAIPTHLHHEAALLALAHGCHVVIEKPVAMNLAQTAEIFADAARRGRCATVYQPYRCTRTHRRLAELLAAGELGEIFLARRLAHSFTRRSDWQALRRFGGGSLMNAGAHFVDQAVALWGRDLRLLAARKRKIFASGDAEDYVHLTLENPAGTVVEIEINPASLDQAAVPDLAVYGSKGNFFQRGEDNRALLLDDSAVAERPLDAGLTAANRRYLSENPDFATEQFQEPPWRTDNPRFYENFHVAVTTGAGLITPPEDTLAVMRLLDEAAAG